MNSKTKCLSGSDHKEYFKTTINCLVFTTFTLKQSAFKRDRNKKLTFILRIIDID